MQVCQSAEASCDVGLPRQAQPIRAARSLRLSSHQLDTRARVSATNVVSAVSGNSRSVCLRVISIQVAPSATRSSDEENRVKSVTSAVKSRTSPTTRARHMPTRDCGQRGSDPAARGQCPPPGPGEPGRDEEEDPDHDHQAERPAHELGEDVPCVVGRLAVVAASDERVDDVVSRQLCSDEADEADDDERHTDPAYGTAAISGEPDREAEGGEREYRQEPGQRLQELDTFCAVSSWSERSIDDRPASAGILSAI